MAKYFSITRPYLSGDLLMLKKYLKPNTNILDLGCGNGRLVDLIDDSTISYTGTDISKDMIDIAKKRYLKQNFILQKDPLKIDASDEAFDQVYCLSVFHHIPSHDLRVEYLKEIARVLKKDGTLIMLNWNLWQRKGIRIKVLCNYLMNRSVDIKDIYLSFKDGQGRLIAKRFIHVFSQRDLDNVFEKAGYNIVQSLVLKRGRKVSNSNFLHILRKDKS